MTVSWTQHRFSGGCLRSTRPTRSCCAAIRRELSTASTIRPRSPASPLRPRLSRRDELAAGRWQSPSPEAIAPVVLAIREATDRLFRRRRVGGRDRHRAICRRFCAPAPRRSRRTADEIRRAGRSRSAIRRADRLRGGAGGFGAVAAAATTRSGKAQDLSELHLAVSRQKPQFQPSVVRHGGVRQPAEGKASLSPPQSGPWRRIRCLEIFAFRP